MWSVNTRGWGLKPAVKESSETQWIKKWRWRSMFRQSLLAGIRDVALGCTHKKLPKLSFKEWENWLCREDQTCSLSQLSRPGRTLQKVALVSSYSTIKKVLHMLWDDWTSSWFEAYCVCQDCAVEANLGSFWKQMQLFNTFNEEYELIHMVRIQVSSAFATTLKSINLVRYCLCWPVSSTVGHNWYWINPRMNNEQGSDYCAFKSWAKSFIAMFISIYINHILFYLVAMQLM